jgi:hypothetical protein
MAGQKPREMVERRDKWWVVHQHDQVTVVKSDEAPSAEIEPGDRIKRLLGPYTSEADAQEVADSTYSRTLRAMAERAGVA